MYRPNKLKLLLPERLERIDNFQYADSANHSKFKYRFEDIQAMHFIYARVNF